MTPFSLCINVECNKPSHDDAWSTSSTYTSLLTGVDGVHSTRLTQWDLGVTPLPPNEADDMWIPLETKHCAPGEAAEHVAGGKHGSIGVRMPSHPCRQRTHAHGGTEASANMDAIIRGY